MKIRNKIISVVLFVASVVLCFSSFNVGVVAAEGNRSWLWPVPSSSRLTSCFEDGRNHNAIDISASQNADVVASYPGTVYQTQYSNTGYGNNIVLQHTFNGTTYYSHYSHLYRIDVSQGDYVQAGQRIGGVGTTGNSTGNHLDFQIFKGSMSNKQYSDPLLDEFLNLPSDFYTDGADRTQCCFNYVAEVRDLYGLPYPEDDITSSGLSAPSSMQQGSAFSVTGTISSGKSELKSVKVGVYTSPSSTSYIPGVGQEKIFTSGNTGTPSNKTYNLSGLDAGIVFNNLSPGTYYYKVEATNYYKTKQLLVKEFVVTGSITATPDVFYRVRTSERGWLPEVKNTEDYAGVRGSAITDVAIRVSSGSVKYRVHLTNENRWLPYVTGCNINDGNNGYAGNGTPIDAIEVIYTPPSGHSYTLYYKVSPVNGNYFSEVSNDYAGIFGRNIDRLQMRIS